MSSIRQTLRMRLGICLLLMIILIVGCTSNGLPTPIETPSPTSNTPSGTIIPFESFRISDYYYRTEGSACIWVITDMQQYNRPPGIEWRPNGLTEPPQGEDTEGKPKYEIEPPFEFEEFDFSTHFILIIFNGNRGGWGSYMKIYEIKQEKDEVHITAHLDDQGPEVPVVPIIISQYTVLKINKDNLSQAGKVTFILFDESGKERARTTVEVSGG